MATNYERGRSFEYRVRDDLISRGYVVMRSAGSRSPADLIAGKPGKILLVQCTTTDKCKDESDRNRLIIMAAFFGNKAAPVMVWKEKERGPLVWEYLHEFTD